jgi:hypothetical protein
VAPVRPRLFDPAHFYRVTEARDVFDNATTFTHDAHSLLLESATDALGNTITAHNDYLVLAPDLVTDPNGNRQVVAFDALGMVIKTAVMGNPQRRAARERPRAPSPPRAPWGDSAGAKFCHRSGTCDRTWDDP